MPCISRALILIQVLIRAGAYLYHRILFIALSSVRSGSTVCILECSLSYTNFSAIAQLPMARPRSSDPTSSDDDAPEMVSHSLSKKNAKRAEKTLRGFEAEQNARKKSQNRERDRKLKERAIVTRMGKLSDKALLKGKQKAQMESRDGSSSEDSAEDETHEDNALEMRMRRAMEDAAAEIGDGDDEDNDEDPEDLSDEEVGGGSGESEIDEGMAELDAESEFEKDEEDGIMDESADEDDDQRKILPPPIKSSVKAQYLEEGLFASAFASQNSHKVDAATKLPQKVQPSRKRQRRPLTHVKDLLVGCVTQSLYC